jgi:hypothetical protein
VDSLPVFFFIPLLATAFSGYIYSLTSFKETCHVAAPIGQRSRS